LQDNIDALLFGAPLVRGWSFSARESYRRDGSLTFSWSRSRLDMALQVIRRKYSSKRPPSSSQASSSTYNTPASSPSSPTKIDRDNLFRAYDSDLVFAKSGLEASDLIFCSLLAGGDCAEGVNGASLKTATALAL
jgi:hypothetical protein